MKSVLTKKTYNLITNPDLPGYSVENYGDRNFILRGQYARGWPQNDGFIIGGDRNWEINDENILRCANAMIEDRIKEIAEEKLEKRRDKSADSIWDEFEGVFDKMHNLMDKAFGRNDKHL